MSAFEMEHGQVEPNNRRWCRKEGERFKYYWCGPTSPTPWEKLARRPEMTKVRLEERRNKDGTWTRTAKCSIEEVTDIDGNPIPNPIQTLYWSPETQDYQIYSDWDDDVITVNVDVDLGVDADFDKNNDINSVIEARECWCARVFQSYQGFVNGDFGEDDDTSVLQYPDQPLFCPIDTNADQILDKKDVTSCTAYAVFSPDQTTILAQESACFQEEPWTEFVRSSWPLCFFWWFILLYILFFSFYGRRVRGFVKRQVCLQRNKFSSKPHTIAFAQATGANNNNNNNDSGNSTTSYSTDEVNGDIELAQVSESITTTATEEATETATATATHTATHTTDTQQQQQQDDSDTTAPTREQTIQQEFGSLLNYNLLDRDLRQQAQATDNEIVTWLWYSAVYNEVRRYRYNQWRRRRQRVSNNNENNNNNDDGDANNGTNDNDTSDDDLSLNSEGFRDPLRSQRLDSVYWWPPQNPDGERWEHLRNRRQNGQPTHDEDGNPIDAGRLTLKTKRFAPEDVIPNNQSNCNALLIQPKGTDTTEDSTGEDTGDDTGDDTNPNTASTTLDDDYDDDEIGDNVCSICLCELEEGDLVGDIQCGHYFHKECLKEWLFKNNHCPICRMPDIASHPILE